MIEKQKQVFKVITLLLLCYLMISSLALAVSVPDMAMMLRGISALLGLIGVGSLIYSKEFVIKDAFKSFPRKMKLMWFVALAVTMFMAVDGIMNFIK
ncbi:hypothetical protein WD019_11990 [Fictibacillus sp. Mic-4]|uniref:hypothetical protein n=1 Tax=Fictibacillus TaxID=1329200 RepID=UPI00041CA956|nr:hypothetical protein [Fictibacillus gelatini]